MDDLLVIDFLFCVSGFRTAVSVMHLSSCNCFCLCRCPFVRHIVRVRQSCLLRQKPIYIADNGNAWAREPILGCPECGLRRGSCRARFRLM